MRSRTLLLVALFLMFFSVVAYPDDEVACSRLLIKFFTALETRDAEYSQKLQNEYEGSEYMPCQFVKVVRGREIPKMYFNDVDFFSELLRNQVKEKYN